MTAIEVRPGMVVRGHKVTTVTILRTSVILTFTGGGSLRCPWDHEVTPGELFGGAA